MPLPGQLQILADVQKLNGCMWLVRRQCESAERPKTPESEQLTVEVPERNRSGRRR